MKSENQTRLSVIKLILYAGPVFPLSMMLGPIGSFIPLFYAKYTAITLSSIGLALLIGRLLDSCTDQIVGYLSDITKSRFGRRKPWLVSGAVVCMASSYALYMPPPDAGFLYFFISLTGIYLGYSMVAIPHLAWGAELTRNYNERAKLSSFIAVLQPLGFALILSLTFLPFLQTTELTPEAVGIMGLVIILVFPLVIGASVAAVPRGVVNGQMNPSLKQLFLSVRNNPPFWRFMSFNLLSYIALGMMSSALPIYMDFSLGLGQDIALAFMLNMAVMSLSVPLWLRVVYRFSKHKALAYSSLITIIILPSIFLLPPGQGALPYFLVWMAAIGAAGGANFLSANAIMADIVDYDTLKTGYNRAGNYYAFIGFLTKAAGAVGGGLAFVLLSTFGFNAKAEVQTDVAIFGLKFAFAYLPITLNAIAVAFVFGFPLNARRQAIISRRLDQRIQRQGKKEHP